jgi:hypothetical protein
MRIAITVLLSQCVANLKFESHKTNNLLIVTVQRL